jgi:hypothetical protein
MTRSFAIAAVAAAAFAAPALADEVPGRDAIGAHGIELARAHDAKQAQQLLVNQGYTAISPLEQVANGRWIGTAQKDGKAMIVGVDLPRPAGGQVN